MSQPARDRESDRLLAFMRRYGLFASVLGIALLILQGMDGLAAPVRIAGIVAGVGYVLALGAVTVAYIITRGSRNNGG